MWSVDTNPCTENLPGCAITDRAISVITVSPGASLHAPHLVPGADHRCSPWAGLVGWDLLGRSCPAMLTAHACALTVSIMLWKIN